MDRSLLGLGNSRLPVAEFLNLPESFSNYAFYNELYPTHGEPVTGPLTEVDVLSLLRKERSRIVRDLDVLFDTTWENSEILGRMTERYLYLLNKAGSVPTGVPSKDYYQLIWIMEFRVYRLCKFIKQLSRF